MSNSLPSVDIEQLVESGAHFGHQTTRFNPKMRPYIFGKRDKVYIIDLAKTKSQIEYCQKVIEKTVKDGKSILFVGTKKQAKGVILEVAQEVGEFYVCERWLGGLLTNLETIRSSIKKLEKIEKQLAVGGDGFTKKELSLLEKERQKLDRNLAGIRNMKKTPGLLIVVDPVRQKIAVEEALALGIEVMALIDTDGDPERIKYVIPCNDDSMKSIALVLRALAAPIRMTKETIHSAKIKEGLQIHGISEDVVLTEEVKE